MNIPLPGLPVRGSKTGKPIMALLDLLGRTWALGVVWQLQYKPLPFRELQRKCDGISPSLLTTRLKELSAAGLVERTIDGYKLSELGDSLFCLIAPLSQWSQDWANSLTKVEKNSQGSRGKKDD
ncbi:winged helix-turn-helix transcriptional regulator [Thalassotalea ganghwensis]